MAWPDSVGRRTSVLTAILLGALALVLPAGPAHAQIQPGAQATPLVGSGIVASCPPATPFEVESGTATVNAVTVGFPATGRCTPLSADAEGDYTIAGSFTNPLPFTSQCANIGGVAQPSSSVTVPTGTIVDGVAVAAPTVVSTPNTAVTYPGGRTAVLNVITNTGTTVIVNAIVFSDGTIVGQAVCGASAYPLAVDVAAEAAAQALGPPISSDGDGGFSVSVVLLGGAFALAVLAQLAIGRNIRRRKGNATV